MRRREPADGRRGSSLAGLQIVNTRSRRQAGALDDCLAERGAVSIPYPCIEIVSPADLAPLETAVAQLADQAYDWVVFTSANAARAVSDVVRRRGAVSSLVDERATRVAAVGPGTAAAVQRLLGLPVALRSPVHTAEALAAELIAHGARRPLIPAAERAREALPRLLGEAGVDATVVTAYRTVTGAGGANLPLLLRSGTIDAIAFTSPSTVEGLAGRFAEEGGDWSLLASVCIGCIGPVTAEAARARGLEVAVEPRDYTINGLVGELESYFNSRIDRARQSGRRIP